MSGKIKASSSADPNIHIDTGMSDEVLVVLMRLLKKYLMDESVEMIDMTSRALRVSSLTFKIFGVFLF